MSNYFLDTSALAKRYHAEIGTAKVEEIFRVPEAKLFISRLSVVEIQSVFAAKVRTLKITETDFRILSNLFRNDAASRVFSVVRMGVSHYREAERLIRKHAPTKGFRTLDALQLAVALELGRSRVLAHFVCADKHLCALAEDEGLSVINPEIP